MQLMEERLHSFPSTTEGLLKKKKKKRGTLFKTRVRLMNRSLWGVQIAASVEGESSCSGALIPTALLLSKSRFSCV